MSDERLQPIHEDVPRARRAYGNGDRDAFKKMYAERERKMRDGQEYWDSSHDATLMRRARRNTGRAIASGNFDWEKAGKKKEQKQRGGRRGRPAAASPAA